MGGYHRGSFPQKKELAEKKNKLPVDSDIPITGGIQDKADSHCRKAGEGFDGSRICFFAAVTNCH